MVSDRLTTKTYKEIAQTVRNQFFPRKLITDRNRVKGLLQSVVDTLQQVSKIAYKPRFVELPVSGAVIDLSNLGIPGIRVKKVLDIVPMSQYNTIFGLYERMMYGQPIFFNLIRNQDNFIDYVFSREVYRQIEEKYQNKRMNWEFVGDKIILGQNWLGLTTQAVVIFIPSFIDEPNSEIAVTAEAAGTIQANTSNQVFYLKEPFVKPGSLSLTFGAVTMTDDGNSNIIGSGVTGYINYSNGELVLRFATAPVSGAFTADYITYDYKWEFTQKEYAFFLEYLEALVSFREGRAQSEMAIAEVPSNADTLLGASSRLEEIVKKYQDSSYIRLGRRF